MRRTKTFSKGFKYPIDILIKPKGDNKHVMHDKEISNTTMRKTKD